MRCTAGRGQAGHAGKKGGLHSAIAEEVEAEVERLIGEGVVDDFQAIETEARRVALQIMGQAVAHRLNADHSDDQGPRLSCGCGGDARYAGRRSKVFTTALGPGPLTLERAWYHCERCHNGFSPRDRALGMVDTFLSRAALRMIGIAAARTSFEGSSALLHELAASVAASNRRPPSAGATPNAAVQDAAADADVLPFDGASRCTPAPCSRPSGGLRSTRTRRPARRFTDMWSLRREPQGVSRMLRTPRLSRLPQLGTRLV